MDNHIQASKEWIARRTAALDQREKRIDDLYVLTPPHLNLTNLNDIEAARFWVSIHQWELDQMIETGSIDEYPQKSPND